jgi:hypothetical protein
MAASPTAMESQDKWSPTDGQGDTMGPSGSTEAENGASLPADAGQSSENPEFIRDSSVGGVSGGSKGDASYREKQVKVLRVYSSLVCLNGVCHAPWTHFCIFRFAFHFSTGSRGWSRLLLLMLFYSYTRFPYISTGVYFLPSSRTRSMLAVFRNIHAKRTSKVVLEK